MISPQYSLIFSHRLIIGAGPSGLMAAYWMARCGVNARIIDNRDTKVFLGHADGLRARTLELFDSMGFQHRVLEEGSISTEANIWVCITLFSRRRACLTTPRVNRSPVRKESLSDRLKLISLGLTSPPSTIHA